MSVHAVRKFIPSKLRFCISIVFSNHSSCIATCMCFSLQLVSVENDLRFVLLIGMRKETGDTRTLSIARVLSREERS